MKVVLTKLESVLREKGLTPEKLAESSQGDFSRMTVRRAMRGKGIDLLKAKAVAKKLHMKLEDLK